MIPEVVGEVETIHYIPIEKDASYDANSLIELMLARHKCADRPTTHYDTGEDIKKLCDWWKKSQLPANKTMFQQALVRLVEIHRKKGGDLLVAEIPCEM